MRASVTVVAGVCLALAGCLLFKHGGGAQLTTTPSASAPTTSAPSAPTSPASTPAPAPAPSAKTPASTPTPAKSPPKKASAPPKPSSPKPATAAGTPTPSQSQSPKPASTASSPPAGAAAPAAAAALDLTGLEQRLRETKAIGMFTKLSLKNQVDDLLTQFKAFHNKQAKLSQSDLRQRYDLLLLKVLSLLQDDDPSLASAISSSREAIWGILIDPVKFAKLS